MDSPEIAVAAFYRFVALDDVTGLREGLRATCAAHGVKGSVLLADEGINGTLAGPPAGMAAVLGWLRGIVGLEALHHKASYADAMPFHRLKVEIKPEIVTFRSRARAPRHASGELNVFDLAEARRVLAHLATQAGSGDGPSQELSQVS